MRLVSGLILMILKSYSLPGSSGPALFSGPVVGRKLEGPSSRRRRSSISVLWHSPSMLSPSSTNAPKVAMRDTLPLTTAHTVLPKPVTPDVVYLLHAQRHSAVFGIDPQYFRGDRLALLEDLVGILHAPSPAHLAHMNKAVEPFFDFDECAEFRDVAYFTGNNGTDRIFFRNQHPGIGLRLLQAERHAAVARLDVQHHHVHFVAGLYDL